MIIGFWVLNITTVLASFSTYCYICFGDLDGLLVWIKRICQLKGWSMLINLAQQGQITCLTLMLFMKLQFIFIDFIILIFLNKGKLQFLCNFKFFCLLYLQKKLIFSFTSGFFTVIVDCYADGTKLRLLWDWRLVKILIPGFRQGLFSMKVTCIPMLLKYLVVILFSVL